VAIEKIPDENLTKLECNVISFLLTLTPQIDFWSNIKTFINYVGEK